MLTHSPVYTLLLLRQRGSNVFGKLPVEIIREISNVGQALSGVETALHHAASAKKEDVEALTVMLDANPGLVRDVGNVITPGGLDVRHVTLYEFALGAGDPELAELIGSYFSKIPHGETEKAKQYQAYKPCIEGMLTQTSYDLSGLIQIIKESSAADVAAELNHDTTHQSKLRAALIQFRKDHALGVLVQPRMHYNYPTLIQAFEKLDQEWDNLENGDNYDKCDLVWRQVIGYLQRGLPAIDRFAFAQGLYDLVENKQPSKRTNRYQYAEGSFPDTPRAEELSGLGFDFGISGAEVREAGNEADLEAAAEEELRGGRVVTGDLATRRLFTKLMASKNNRLAELMPRQPTPKPPGCVIC